MKPVFLVRFFFCVSASLISWGLMAQNYIMSNSPINACTGIFYDPGGPNNNYGPNQNFTTTICATGTAGTHSQLIFSAPQLGAGDQLCFYDGNTVMAPLLSCAADFEPGQPFVIQATAANPGGCLTIQFISDGDGEGAGWSASIKCVAACQLIQANLVSSTPAVVPADTGWIDVCPGQRIFLSGNGRYPQNGIVYNHSDSTSSFQWTFGDGGAAVGPDVSYIYNEPGGYIIQMTVTDQFGCKNTNFLTQRVRVSTRPNFNLTGDIDAQICAGDTIVLNANVGNIDTNFVFSVVPTPGTFQSGGIRSDSLPLPDGTGAVFSTPISFTDFSPGQALTNINDLLGICVNMEHSWVHDLEIRITCPSGQTAILHNFISPPTTGGAGETLLGIPFDPDPPGHPNAIQTPWGTIVPGTGWDYCWTPTATNGTWRQFATANNPGTLPAGNYSSFQPLTNLLGCPLNGEWTLAVEDRWGADNGFIFNWSINFAPELFPRLETFTPEIVDYGWTYKPSIIAQTPSTITAVPVNAGTASYTFQVTDNFGCVYDTSVNITVLPFTHPSCYSCVENIAPMPDTLICPGDSVMLSARPNIPFTNDVVFEAYPLIPFGFSTNPPANPLNSVININSIRPLILTNPSSQIVSVCIDIETDWLSDLRIFLRAPNGALLELTTNNGGGGDNYTNTCFSPSATTFIQNGTPPFTGFFRPEGMWTALNGAPVNGNWTLVASDAFGLNDIGQFNWWSITFRSENNVTYTWSPAAGLSCTNCPAPIARPGITTTYTVQSTDAFNCQYSRQVTVSVGTNIPAPQVSCGSLAVGELNFSWLPVGNYTQYEIRVITNGQPGLWQGPFEFLNYDVFNLNNGDEVTLEVRVFLPPSANICDVAVGAATCTYLTCTLSAALSGSTTDVTCNGLSNGAATITAAGGLAPVAFYLDGSTTPQSNGIFNTLSAGNHTVLVEDGANCQVLINFTINEPPPLQVNIIQTQSISCFQGSNGALNALAQGGNGAYQFSWSGGTTASTQAITMLSEGSYTVMVTDQQGCTASNTLSINAPSEVVMDLFTSPISCSGTNNGSINVLASGGVGGFSYTWSPAGLSGPQQNTLVAGTYCVTATDANGCTVADCTTLTEPAPLQTDSLLLTHVSCFNGNNGTARLVVSGGTAPYSYAWNDPAGQLGVQAVFLRAGNYTVTITDLNNCLLTSPLSITQPDALSVSFTTSNPLCAGGNTGTATAIPGGGTGNYTFLWQNGTATAGISNVPEGTYQLTITDSNGCTLPSQVALTAPAPLILSVAQSRRGCFGINDNQALSNASGGVTPYTFAWSNGQTSNPAINLAPGLHSVTLTDNNGCTTTQSLTLSDLDSIRVNIISERPSCNGLADGALGVNILLGGAGGPVSSYQFQWSNNATGPIISNLRGGILYRLTITDAQGCTGRAQKFLEEPSLITFDITKSNVRCFGMADGTATVTNVQGDNPAYTYLWSPGTGSQISATATALQAGRHTVTVTDANGCSVSGEVTLSQPDDIILQLSTTANKCFGDAIGSATIAASGGTPAYAFEWPGNRIGTSITGLSAGVYVATVTDAQGCIKTLEAIINQPEILQAELDITDVACHNGRNGRIGIRMSGGTPAYTYSLDNRTYNGASTLIGLSAGTYFLYVKDANNCTFFTEAEVKQPDEFTVEAGQASYIIDLGDSLILNANAFNAQGNVEFVWSAPYGNTLSCTECASTLARPTNQITYELYGIDANGCEDTDLITVFVEKERIALVPTGFTPNDDGRHDRLLVHGRNGTKVISFRIFDRWGQLIFQGGDFLVNDEAGGWDGHFRGSHAPSGVYIWQLILDYPDGVRENYQGQTTLIR